MRRLILASMLGVSLAGVPALVGCDREVEHSKTVDVKDNGTVVKKETKTTENADGSVTKTESKDVNK